MEKWFKKLSRPKDHPVSSQPSKVQPSKPQPSKAPNPTMAPTTAPAPSNSNKQDNFRDEIEKAFAKVSNLVKHSLGPVNAKYPYQPADDPGPPTGGLLADLATINFPDVKTLLLSFYDKIQGVQDDNTLLLEHLVQLLSKLPSNSKIGNELTDGFVNQLWSALPHPPVVSLGKQYKYRDADGGNNNIAYPDLGRAETPYARSSKPQILQNIALPDPSSIFDSLMARGDHFEEHPNKISSMLFYLASIIIHDLFRTDHIDLNKSNTSSYLDLAPLYGSNQGEQDLMRTGKDGQLKPDCFSEKRLLGFPPGVGVILIMFNRFHNYIVHNLALINENGRFTKPANTLTGDAAAAAWKTYDNDLFQTARLINCGLYVNVILKDYVRTILSLNRSGTPWDLDPRAVSAKTLLNTPAPEGVGNQVSAEFNLIYRWHSAISQKDDKWTQEQFGVLGVTAETSLPDLVKALIKWEKNIKTDPQAREFAGLTRSTVDGKFSDDDLVAILTSSIEDVAGSFGANKVPKIMRSVEMLGIIQARAWNLGSLNEFRQFFGLTKHKTFEDINPDKEVVAKLKNLYDSPDFVELYPGLVAEKAKPPMSPGSGLCVNYTTSRAILSDAVGLVRGDRFYTTDYTPKNLTNWGYAEVDYDLTVNEGCVFYKLIYRSFPNHFKGNSIYAYFPFVIPDENKVIMKELKRVDLYDWSKPAFVPALQEVTTYKAVASILSDQTNFKVTWGPSIAYAVEHPNKNYGVDYCLAGDKPANTDSRKLVMKALYPKDWTGEVKKFYQETTVSLLKKYSYKIGSANQVDIVRDVVSLVNTHFSASLFSLPLKTEDHPFGIYTEQELYQVLSVSFFAIFYDIDPAKSFMLKNAARTLTEQLGDLVLFNVEAIKTTGVVADWIAKLHAHSPLTDFGTHMIQRLLESGQSVKDVVWTTMMPTASSMVANQTQLFMQVLDFYLEEGNKKHLADLVDLAHKNTPEADEKILRYFLEAARLRQTVGVFRDAASDQKVVDGATTLTVPAKHRIFINLIKASHDPAVFPEPNTLRLDRDLGSYIHYGWGPHQCAGKETSQLALSTMLKEIVKLPGLRRALGPQGQIKRVPADFGYEQYMLPDWSAYYPVPTTMKIMWDGAAPSLALPPVKTTTTATATAKAAPTAEKKA